LKEFGDTQFRGSRLTARLIKLADSLISMPESSINQACGSWAEVKSAYRFFQNDNVLESEILKSHVTKTVERIKPYRIILVV
jgi:hypothetical protein